MLKMYIPVCHLKYQCESRIIKAEVRVICRRQRNLNP
jgi:hypothetical protein